MAVLPTLQKQRHPLASGAAQRRRLAELPLGRSFENALESAGLHPLRAAGIDVLQINVGRKCNQTCHHCHVDAGPDRTEMMPAEVVDRCLEVLAGSAIPTVDIERVPDPVPEGLHVLDVREDVEWAYGHIEGAQHIPLMQLPGRLDELPDTKTLVVCKVGGRSAQAVSYLQAQGRDAVNLDGGMLDWSSAGRPMVSETGDAPQVV